MLRAMRAGLGRTVSTDAILLLCMSKYESCGTKGANTVAQDRTINTAVLCAGRFPGFSKGAGDLTVAPGTL